MGATAPRRHGFERNSAWVIALAALGVALIGTVGIGFAGGLFHLGEPGPPAAAIPTASPTPSPSVLNPGPPPSLVPVSPSANNLVVTINDVRGAKGSTLLVVVSLGDPPQGIGGFAVTVSTDPFSVTETVREGSPFPWLEYLPGSRPAATVPNGSYVLYVYIQSVVNPYSEWVPAEPVEQRCEAPFTVDPGGGHILVTGVAPAGPLEGSPVCKIGVG